MSEKKLFFDAGPIITLVMSRMIWILPKLKEKFGGSFYITPAVKEELVVRPLTIRRFQFEALQVTKLIKEGVLEVYDQVPTSKINQLIRIANGSFKINNKALDVIQRGEIESAVSALSTNAQAVVMDERTLRLFIERNKDMKSLLERRFKSKVETNQERMDLFSAELKGLTIIRSIDLVSIAYKMGIFDSYVPSGRNAQEVLVNSILWATKYNGCAVSDHEVHEIKELLLSRR